MPRKRANHGPEDPDGNTNRVTIEALRSLIESLEERIDIIRGVVNSLEKHGFEAITTSNWTSSGLYSLELLRRTTDALWTAIGKEAELSWKIESMKQQAKKPSKRTPN
jgi:hypothetical protein